jgi:hypothetical protein
MKLVIVKGMGNAQLHINDQQLQVLFLMGHDHMYIICLPSMDFLDIYSIVGSFFKTEQL